MPRTDPTCRASISCDGRCERIMPDARRLAARSCQYNRQSLCHKRDYFGFAISCRLCTAPCERFPNHVTLVCQSGEHRWVGTGTAAESSDSIANILAMGRPADRPRALCGVPPIAHNAPASCGMFTRCRVARGSWKFGPLARDLPATRSEAFAVNGPRSTRHPESAPRGPNSPRARDADRVDGDHSSPGHPCRRS